MTYRGARAVQGLVAALALGACADTVTDRVTGVPSLQVVGGTTQCIGGPTTPSPSLTYDNIEVPPGATCFLNDVTVLGNVKALLDSRLFMQRDVVHGNVEGDKAALVHVFDSHVGGNIQIRQGKSPPSENGVHIKNTDVETGNVQIEQMETDVMVVELSDVQTGSIQLVQNQINVLLSVERNVVAQNVQIFKNVGDAFKNVFFNEVAESVQCFENSPVFVGLNFAPNSEGQCLSL
jgi:hypothetical protein